MHVWGQESIFSLEGSYRFGQMNFRSTDGRSYSKPKSKTMSWEGLGPQADCCMEGSCPANIRDRRGITILSYHRVAVHEGGMPPRCLFLEIVAMLMNAHTVVFAMILLTGQGIR